MNAQLKTQIPYTPGPWRVGHHTQMSVSIRVFDNDKATRGAIAQAFAEGMSHDQLDECEANARLIAAAPALLEALRECVAAYVDVDHANTYTSDDVLSVVKANERIRTSVTAAREIIAKAVFEIR